MKKAIIIGASSGIGKVLSKLLVEDNYKVGITGRRTELLQELSNTKQDSYLIKSFDVTNTDNSISKLEELLKELGSLDLIILSSGTGDLNNELDFNIERNTIDLNVTGFTNIANWAFKYFENQGHGHLVGISSIGGLRGSRQAPAYNATKSYQINYLEALRQKSKKINSLIQISDIRPGLVDTDMAKGDGLFWVMPVEKVAKQIYNGIKKKKRVVYVTKRWRLLAFILKKIPSFIYEKM